MKTILTILITAFLCGFLLLFLTEKINLATADLGRHLKNGEILLKGNFEVLQKNFYSFSNPEFPFLNHHWGAGVVFYILKKIGGFKMVHLFYLLLFLLTFSLMILLAKQEAGNIAFLISLFLVPLIAQRREVRPEIFSYFFSAVFFFILTLWQKGKLKNKDLLFLLLLQIFWTNLHIFFFMGWGIVAAFLIESLVKKEKQNTKTLALCLTGCILTATLNPFGGKLFFYPLQLIKNYGYRIVENQSVIFLERLGVGDKAVFWLFKITFGGMLFSFFLNFKKNKKEFGMANFLIASVTGTLAFLAIRNFSLFGLLAIPSISHNIKKIIPQEKLEKFDWEESFLCCVLTAAIFLIIFSSSLPANWGIGLIPGINQGAEFFESQNLKGPVFNNYDIGGYLIYHLFPKEKVFVDNRPEAYPAFFLKNEYILPQQNQSLWEKLQKKYNFNVIFFWWHDYTPWGQKFLIERIKDPQWVPVFVDNYTILFLKNTRENKKTIEKYKIPSQFFKIAP